MECLQCQKPIQAGRADRKFCNDGCKNEYHNRERAREYSNTSHVISRLKQNRRILEGLLGERPEMFLTRDVLAKYGFDFDFHTHRHVSAQGNTFLLCFNFGYRVMDGQRVKIVKWELR